MPGLPIAEWGTPSALVYAALLGSVGVSALLVALAREIRGSCHRLSSMVPEVSLMTLFGLQHRLALKGGSSETSCSSWMPSPTTLLCQWFRLIKQTANWKLGTLLVVSGAAGW